VFVPPADAAGRLQILDRISLSMQFDSSVDTARLAELSQGFTAAVVLDLFAFSNDFGIKS
jgi:ATP-dependent 26S proteasome regulatory subunit